jgi:hypothetical protein
MPNLRAPVEKAARVSTISHRLPYWSQTTMPRGGGAGCCTMALERAGLLPWVEVTVLSFRGAGKEPSGPWYFTIPLVLPI